MRRRWCVLFLIASPLVGGTANLAAQTSEWVIAKKVMDDTAIVVRGNGSNYLIEKGVGCSFGGLGANAFSLPLQGYS